MDPFFVFSFCSSLSMGFDSSQRKEARTNGVTIVFFKYPSILNHERTSFQTEQFHCLEPATVFNCSFLVLECRYLKVLLNGLEEFCLL